MTIWDVLFIVLMLGVGLIAGLVLLSWKSFEPIEYIQPDNTEGIEKALREEYNWQKEHAGLDRLDELLMLEDESLDGTDPPLLPPSDAELSAIEYLSREDDWL